jgi:hypothetical protein
MAESKSLARQLQEVSHAETNERQIRMTIIDDKSVEYHLVKAESVVKGIISPDISDVFIAVPVPEYLKGSVVRSYLHTSRIARLWLHDDLSDEQTARDGVI